MRFALLDNNAVVYITNVGVDEVYENGKEYYGRIAQSIPDDADADDVLKNWYWHDGWQVKPSQPSYFYYWDMPTQSWVLNTELALQAGKSKQSQYLMMTAWTQLPDADLTAEKIQQWADYRAALKAMTDADLTNDNFPPQPI